MWVGLNVLNVLIGKLPLRTLSFPPFRSLYVKIITLITQLCLVTIMSTVALAQEQKITTKVGRTKVVTTVDTVSKTVRKAEVKESINQEWTVDEESTDTVDDVLEDVIETLESTVVFDDCNENGLDDLEEIQLGSSDSNMNVIIDDCEYDYGDLNLDRVVDKNDIFILLGWFGSDFPVYGDLNKDGIVDSEDLGILLARWGQSPF